MRILDMMVSYGCIVFDVIQINFLEMNHIVVIEYRGIYKPKGIAFLGV
jgi:hypothetical protein